MSDSIENSERHQPYEIRQNGDLIVLQGETQWLAGVGKNICEKLNGGLLGLGDVAKALADGETLRPGGAYSVWIRKGQLYVDTRNAAGDPEAQQQIKKAVDSSL